MGGAQRRVTHAKLLLLRHELERLTHLYEDMRGELLGKPATRTGVMFALKLTIMRLRELCEEHSL
jgi:hypothetical protein